MNDENEISYEGIDEAELVLALYHGTRALGMGVLNDRAGLTLEDVRADLARMRDVGEFGIPTMDLPDRRGNSMIRFDYYHGRPLKLSLDPATKTLRGVRLYDRDAGQGACRRVVEGLRNGARLGCDLARPPRHRRPRREREAMTPDHPEDFSCSTCGASAGEVCRTPIKWFHPARWAALEGDPFTENALAGGGSPEIRRMLGLDKPDPGSDIGHLIGALGLGQPIWPNKWDQDTAMLAFVIHTMQADLAAAKENAAIGWNNAKAQCELKESAEARCINAERWIEITKGLLKRSRVWLRIAGGCDLDNDDAQDLAALRNEVEEVLK